LRRAQGQRGRDGADAGNGFRLAGARVAEKLLGLTPELVEISAIGQ
jgi:hypothetical protein